MTSLTSAQPHATAIPGETIMAQSTVSKHLACLRDCGLVSSRAEGRASVFRLEHPEALLELFAAAERLLVLTGDAVTLCPTFGVSGTAQHPEIARSRNGTKP